MKATAKDLRFHSREILEAVSRGEEVIITFRGKPLAKIIPINQENHKNKGKDELFGIWRDNPAVQDVDKFVRESRKGRYDAD
jgi:prevent-host-death family protein